MPLNNATLFNCFCSDSTPDTVEKLRENQLDLSVRITEFDHPANDKSIRLSQKQTEVALHEVWTLPRGG